MGYGQGCWGAERVPALEMSQRWILRMRLERHPLCDKDRDRQVSWAGVVEKLPQEGGGLDQAEES